VKAAQKSAAIQCNTIAAQISARTITNNVFIILSPPPLAFLEHSSPTEYLQAAAALEAHTALLLMNTSLILIPCIGTVLPAAFKTASCRSPPLSTRSDYSAHFTGVAKNGFTKFLGDLASQLALRG